MNPTALLLDPTGKVGHEYAATNTPHMYVIDPEGKADLLRRNRQTNRRPILEDVAGATNYVKAALDGSDGGKACRDADLARLRLLDQIRAITEGSRLAGASRT